MGSKAPTEQPQAPDSAVNTDTVANVNNDNVPDTANATNTPDTTKTANTSGTTNSTSVPDVSNTVSPANAKSQRSRVNKKRIGVIAGIAAAVLVVVGVVVLAINLINNRNLITASPDATVQDITKRIDQLSKSSNIDSMMYYIDNIAATKNDGSAHQNLTNQDMGNIYNDGMMAVMNYISSNQDLEQRDNYTTAVINYAHSADDLLQTGDSAASVYVAESAFGNMEVANQYLQIAKERGINYNIEPEGQE